MVFFLNAEEKVYARYGGRDAACPDSRHSLGGLRYTMQSVLQMHARDEKAFAPKSQEAPRLMRGLSGSRRGGGCMHCHHVKEVRDTDLRRTGHWSRDMVWTYPLPANLGLELERDRGNVIQEVQENSPAWAAGLQAGDRVRQLNRVPIHSFADAQFALERAPRTGSIAVVWERGEQILKGKLALSEGWRKTDLSWRPSLRHLLASARLDGTDLTPQEKKALGLSATQLAFRQKDSVPRQAQEAGIRGGDIVLGVDDKPLEMDVAGFLRYIQGNYLIGDQVTVQILRGGKRMNLTMTFRR